MVRPATPTLLAALVVCVAGASLAHAAAPLAPAPDARVVTVSPVGTTASEPAIAQPVCIEFDDRGRLWVIQYLQYPNPSGLKRAKVDRWSRTTYDRVPEPPPYGPRGADRITILTDTDGDGRMDQSRDFVDGLNKPRQAGFIAFKGVRECPV